jgi:hypothetical protein
MLFSFAMISVVLFFLREIFTANAASPPVDTEPATINQLVGAFDCPARLVHETS